MSIGDPGLFALSVVAGLFGVLSALLLILRRPFAGIVCIMVMHFWFGSIQTGFYPRILSIIFVAIIFVPLFVLRTYGERSRLDTTTKKVVGLSLVLFVLEVFITQVVHRQGIDLLVGTSAKVLIPILLGVMIYAVIHTEEQLSRYMTVLTFLVAASAAIGIFQYLDFSWAWTLREMQGGAFKRTEPSGLALYSLHFSYQLAYLFPCVFSAALQERFLSSKNIFFTVSAMIILAALLLTAVRSALLGVIVGCLVSLIGSRDYAKALATLGVLGIAGLAFITSVDISSVLTTVTTFDDKSAVGRIPLLLAGLYIARDNLLFGIGADRFSDVADAYYGNIYHLRMAESIAYLPPHNQFVNMLVFYGLPALVIIVLFYTLLAGKLLSIRRRSAVSYSASISAGLLGAHISYCINSCFHNMGPFLSDPYAWFLIAASLVVFRLSDERESAQGQHRPAKGRMTAVSG